MFKNDFPIFEHFEKQGKPLVYLDSAAMAHSPRVVIEAVAEHAGRLRSNVHRGAYSLSEEATMAYEDARETVRKFLNARSVREIIFLRNTTEALNLVAASFGISSLKEGDHILVSRAEHHSNFLPWTALREEKGVVLDIVDVDEKGEISLEWIKHALTPRTKLAAFFYVSNVLGAINPVKEWGKLFRERGIAFVVDAAQAVPHIPIDVQELGCDFLAFSGYKIGAPTGIGVLYGREELLEKMPPVLLGGRMIREVSVESASWNDLPWKFEAGTQNIEGAIGLAASIKYIESIGFEKIRKNEEMLLERSVKMLDNIPNLKLFGPKDVSRRAGVISFLINGVHPHDLASLLDREGVCIRVGHHCAMPLHKWLGVPATARASFWVYNSFEDVDALMNGIEKAISIITPDN
ncbi:MAG: hypothetical protein A3C07_02445 [Candidatus Sungbacteria bacterium RIFCSPHIGHO2_02_FULL_47_11]|uniref:cysteine desulfurase n=1 Tax=Candidatus Sungbacteria bacterium RIFCSPHIGHO2_02_FULL_47_11 TaxID=1802270 RepID=A0A1G2KGU6_9BACT|nr:MAG: hypothetical protein A3C07_02445 [Candidatus Sungbacteria bacterium RIFCSPHIGHO2_02_FULL_47_11]